MRECFCILLIKLCGVKFELPRVEDLKLTTIEFDSKCNYLTRNNTHMNGYFPKPLAHWLKIVPYVEFYNKQIEYDNCMAYEILTNEIGLKLPTFPKDWLMKVSPVSYIIRDIRP